ncbi:hypothetical protein [Cryobacterium mannosilyticum]|uniref:Uncharacterized protein n=1 Tax=Cryobacterium mannosilyticum TaxID=1259190 RepID=A0A4R8WBZ5_9MICO|nr:hypothetical protein [Cryobacterium mannosilyticum]TFC06756.1 hypothetical protein E3O32_03325 [Cryobacterium mannosilyticum]
MSELKPTAAGKRSRGRSPAYPAIGLEKAVQRVRLLWLKDKQYSVPVSTVAPIWGYASLNGPAALTVSALVKFGLVDSEGSKDDRTIAVTDLAVQILNHPSSDARREYLKEAALLPPIHVEMWDLYGVHLPSDANLLWKLVRERGFTDTGAKEFIREYRETIAFAELGVDDASEADLEEPLDDVVEMVDVAVPEALLSPTRPGLGVIAGFTTPVTLVDPNSATPLIQNYPIPIALQGRPPVIVSGAFPLSDAEWAQFTAVLEAMRPVLVQTAGNRSA